MVGMNHTRRWAAGIKANKVIAPNLIFFFNDTSIPDGFSRFDSPDGKRIIGAGSTYSPGDNGGDTSLTISSEASDSQGGHAGTASFCTDDISNSGASSRTFGASTEGAHTHDFSGSGNLEPDYQQLLMIKATRWHSQLPANCMPLWHLTGSNPGSLIQQYTAKDDTLIRAGASIATGGTTTMTGITSTSAGGHSHGSANCQTASILADSLTAGAHSHTDDLEFTFNVKRLLLGLWTDAAANFNLEENMIAMYENVTPPAGWSLCNGSGGTPDLRDYFLGIANQANQGGSAGDNTFSATHATHTWTHAHCSGATCNWAGSSKSYHGSLADGNHAHTLNFTDADYLPSYYALAFVMYTGL